MNNVRRSAALYCRWRDSGTGLIKPFKRILRNVFVSEQESTIARKTGIILKESTIINIFSQDDLTYVPLHIWNKLEEHKLEGKYTVDIVPPQSFIVLHESDHDFDFMSMNDITAAENTFISSTADAKRIVALEEKLRGSPRVRHITVRC